MAPANTSCVFHGGDRWRLLIRFVAQAPKLLECLNIGGVSNARQDTDLLARLASSGDGNIIA